MKSFSFVLFFCFLILSAKSFSQDQFYSQIYGSGLYQNPAFTGAIGHPKLSMAYRNEFSSIEQSYQSIFMAYDMHIENAGGLGLFYSFDKNKNAINTSKTIGLNYAYHFDFNDNFGFQPGISIAGSQRKLDYYLPDTVPFYGYNDPYAIIEQPIDMNYTYPDISLGFLLYDNNLCTGLAVHHINKPKAKYIGDENSRLNSRYVYHIGYNIKLSKEAYFTPLVHFSMQGDFITLFYQNTFYLNGLIGGLGWYKNFDTEGFALHLKLGGRFNNLIFGYSYDFFIHPYYTDPFGFHELMVNFVFNVEKSSKINVLEIMAL
jgi:type IX secretion system PorP/SprF family membrane protein